MNLIADSGVSMIWRNVRLSQLFGLLVGNYNNA